MPDKITRRQFLVYTTVGIGVIALTYSCVGAVATHRPEVIL